MLAIVSTLVVWIGRVRLLDHPVAETIPAGMADDASRRNSSSVAEVWPIPRDPKAAEAQLRALLARAREQHLKVSIAGARHTMGGHTITPGGIVIDMLPFSAMELDPDSRNLRVGAGARWSEIIPYLDARGFSVAVMQSNDDFSVGGSVSVNCHGWQVRSPPISATVEAFRLMKADGEIVRCTRAENRELFGLALGGYGLFGVILDVELRIVPNRRYETETTLVSTEGYAALLRGGTADPRVEMAYGRVCVAPGEDFLREGLLTVFRNSECTREEIPNLAGPRLPWLRRAFFRAQIDSEAGKSLRWIFEKKLGEQVSAHFVSRNELLFEGAQVYTERNADRADVIHESFVPPERFAEFLRMARDVFASHPVDLLNVTVRSVERDDDTFLRYADRDLIALVMLFDVALTPEGDHRIQEVTRGLVEAALTCGGRYYLPYRGDATRDQFERAYPMAPAWAENKRRYDPENLFSNVFFERYGSR